MPIVFAVTGHRNSGKTTAIEAISAEMSRRGYRVGTFKHCHHAFDLDRRGKDSWRHRRGGSIRTVLTSPAGMAMIGEPPTEEDPRQIAEWLLPDVDVVLAEGYHWLPITRIEVVGADGRTREGHPEGRIFGRHVFGAPGDQIQSLCDRLDQELQGKPEIQVNTRARQAVG